MKFKISPKIFKPLKQYISNINIGNKCSTNNGIFKSTNRIIAIGDIHGDFDVLLIALFKAKCINIKGNWIGGNTIVVQLGDILDRGGRGFNIDTNNNREELDIIQYMEEIHKMALRKNGAVYSVLGNHEIMNVLGDFRYTTSNTLKGFGGNSFRKRLFKPGGKLAKQIACHTYGIIQIGDWIFVHGGILPEHVNKFSIAHINILVKNILLGNKNIDNLTHDESSLLLGERGIFWTRLLSSNIPRCDLVNDTMATLRLDNCNGGIVVGHTPQNGINGTCNKKLWKIDNGMSRAFGERQNNNKIQILEIIQNGKQINIIK